MTPPPMREVLRGVVLLGRFRRRGFAHVGGTAQDVLASMAPLLALLIVSATLRAAAGADSRLLVWVLAALSVLLMPMVVSEALARSWGREPAWARYAAAFNWCQWAVTFVAIGAILGANLLAAVGLPPPLAAGAAMLAILAYHLGLQWFLARRGLDLSPGRSVLLVAAVEVLTSLVLVLFLLLDGDLAGAG